MSGHKSSILQKMPVFIEFCKPKECFGTTVLRLHALHSIRTDKTKEAEKQSKGVTMRETHVARDWDLWISRHTSNKAESFFFPTQPAKSQAPPSVLWAVRSFPYVSLHVDVDDLFRLTFLYW